MDSGKLPNYRSSYLFRFHPYARVKPSARELVMNLLIGMFSGYASLYPSDDDGFVSDEQPFIPSYGTVVPDSKLSMSTLAVDLALLMCRKPSPTD
ncbi:hypothetical protein PISMIDRAFT_690252 [Pisolithus microcarpus 441]|uniref:Uncharacterized protein n=1 Tax=Pisolithus microcarpus 441 TaxID=765257 RepID=A0A0C9YMT8_9AGAM|nr:hypothetical protein BKA83DRAFT_690252 [Pisolithus microcarpus]KIK11547.1 hypothetical protein PISMIDRAFT_690252 [Pisolithus microcarpus 441]